MSSEIETGRAGQPAAGAGVPQPMTIADFLNWSGRPADAGQDAAAKAAALQAAAALPDSDPVSTVAYESSGNTLVVGPAQLALQWATQLAAELSVSVLVTDGAGSVPAAVATFPVFIGDRLAIRGYLGAFDASWMESASGSGGGPVALSRAGRQREMRFDLILDLGEHPAIALHQPPQGYFAPGSDPAAQAAAAEDIAQMVGHFEKPKYFSFQERLCAHSRNHLVGCTSCIDICSAKAIASAGERIKVNPYLCAGCGACSTVCPSGALSYTYPSASDTGARLKAALGAYLAAGGSRPAILFHGEDEGAALLEAVGPAGSPAQAEGAVPARMLALGTYHAASVGIDVWLSAVAYGASSITVLMTPADAPQYVATVRAQMDVAQTILTGLGYKGVHFQLIHARGAADLRAALADVPAGETPTETAKFNLAAAKRNSLDLALDHLYRQAEVKPAEIALPPRSPFGTLKVDSAACSLCMSCVGACPELALLDGQNEPQLRFIEKNCVQCGLCEETCPENAITLVPRLSFGEHWNQPVVLNKSQPFCCISCSKPFGTMHMIQTMLAKLSSHSAFSGNLDRLKMCGDCRVVDMMKKDKEM